MYKSIELTNDDDNFSIHKGETCGVSKQEHVVHQNKNMCSIKTTVEFQI